MNNPYKEYKCKDSDRRYWTIQLSSYREGIFLWDYEVLNEQNIVVYSGYIIENYGVAPSLSQILLDWQMNVNSICHAFLMQNNKNVQPKPDRQQ